MCRVVMDVLRSSASPYPVFSEEVTSMKAAIVDILHETTANPAFLHSTRWSEALEVPSKVVLV